MAGTKDNRRPYVTVRRWEWRKDGKRTEGIGLMHGASVCAHLTPDEARALADKLHDLADTTEKEKS
ncbi:hypothetical protein [Arthrobacter zhaoxinii]|uniref:hypothetical protein n=1 Tax=Arthrobacter zhaoxinii TaxID=2964616 RepID=UPI00210846DF|nr:hypothetical protein [Arthrobacter zhaoxinii]MCQ1999539.1 hypothetical protein [Arthrobacter zhaoxinii]